MGDTEETIEEIEGGAEEEAIPEEAGVKKLLGPTMIKTLIYVAIALVMIIISGTVAYIVAQRVGKPPATEKTSPEVKQFAPLYAYFDLEKPFSINTADTDEPHFVKVSISLGYEEGRVDIQTELNKRRPQIRDIVIQVIGSKKYSQLDSYDERMQLKEELMNRINEVLKAGKIKEVVFTEFVLT